MKLYVIGGKSGPIKIGISQSLTLRLKQLQTASPVRLSVLFAIDVPDEAARQVEGHIHSTLRMWLVNGEWFSCSADMAIEEIINSTKSVRPTMQAMCDYYNALIAQGVERWDAVDLTYRWERAATHKGIGK